MATDIKSDLLPKACDALAEFLVAHAESIATGTYTVNFMDLPEELLDPLSMQVVGDQITEEMAKNPPPLDKLMLLNEYSEMLASLQKEYYVISNRHDRIGRLARGTAITKHAGSDKGFVRKRIKQAGGAY